MSDAPTVKLKWKCVNAVGRPYWQTLDIYECDECGHEFTTEEDPDDVSGKLCSAECPKCHQDLNMHDDNPEVVK